MSFNVNPARQILRWSFIFLFLLSGCGGRTVKPVPTSFPEQKNLKSTVSKPSSVLELISADTIPSLLDDLDQDSLVLAIERSLQYFNRFSDRDVYYLGALQSTVGKMKETLITFRDIVKLSVSAQVKEEKIRAAFDFYRSTGDDGNGRVIFTGYYQPLLEGSFTKTDKYRYPLYKTPEEMVAMNPGRYHDSYRNERLAGRINKGEALSRFKRAEIDEGGALTGRNLEIIWVDDFVDLFFLHIQGSGKIRLPDGSLVQIGYAQSNGYPYRSISTYLLEQGKLTKNGLSLKTIKKYLREHPEETQTILNYNERYIFFRFVKDGPIGALGIPVTGGRTIASDHAVYPKGALALIRVRKPVIERETTVSWRPFSRFVLNQDVGNAIIGAGRIDLFCGSGNEAEMVAGTLKEPGELYFFIKR